MFKKFAHIRLGRKLKILLVVIVFSPVLFINVRNSHEWGDDFAQYINQAKCIVEGKSQTETGYIFNEQNPYIGPPTYPIGFPALLAPVYAIFGNNILAFSVLISISLFALSLILFYFYRLFFDFVTSIIITAAFIYNPWIMQFKASVLSDIPFTFFFILSIFYYLRCELNNTLQIKNSIILGLLICILLLFKSIGIVIFLGILIDQLIKIIKSIRRIKKINGKQLINPLILILSLVISYVVINKIIIPSPTEHYSFFSTLFNVREIGNTIAHQYKYYTSLTKSFFTEDVVFSSLTLVLLLLGFVKTISKKTSVIDYIFTIYILIIISFPAIQGFRYLLPIYPVVMLYIVFGARSLGLNFKYRRQIILTVFSVLLFLNYYHHISRIIKSQDNILVGPQEGYSVEAFNYIKTNTNVNSVFACVKPRALALYTSRKSIAVGIGYDLNLVDEKFNQVGVNYILTIDDKKNTVMENYLKRYEPKIELIWENEKFKLYRRGNIKKPLEEAGIQLPNNH